MEADALLALTRAIKATRHGGGPKTLARRLRLDGPGALDEITASLSPSQLSDVEQEALDLAGRGVRAVVLGDDRYPASLAATREAPPALFYQGALSDLQVSGLAMAGARNASPEGIQAASECARALAAIGITVVSGYAKGVDMACHSGALEAGGRTLVVLAEGISRFRVKRGEFSHVFDPDRVTVVSQFSPTQPWSAGSAMTRNSLVLAVSRGLVVVEAAESGGTLAAGRRALQTARPVLVLQFNGMLSGNRLLISEGATPISGPSELASRLTDWESPGEDPAQLALM